MTKLLLLILEVRFKNKTPLIEKDNRVEFIEQITGKAVQPPPNAMQGLDFNHEPTKTRIVLEENRFALTVQIESEKDAQIRLLEVLSKIYHDFQYEKNEIARIGVRTSWITDWGRSYTNLVNKYRSVFYKENDVFLQSIDLAVNLTLKDDKYKVNYISGPMKPDEGKDHVLFKDVTFSHDFIFVDVDRYKVDDIADLNSVREIKKVLQESIKYGKSKAEQTVNLLQQ